MTDKGESPTPVGKPVKKIAGKLDLRFGGRIRQIAIKNPLIKIQTRASEKHESCNQGGPGTLRGQRKN